MLKAKKMEIINIIILSLSSLMLVFVGAMRLSHPVKTYLKNSGIKLENDIFSLKIIAHRGLLGEEHICEQQKDN